MGWVAISENSKETGLEKKPISLPPLGRDDVLIQVQACGICHSDLHLIDNDWGVSRYPFAPGHEIVGKVVAKGMGAPDELKLGTVVGIGWQRGSCGKCENCLSGRDNLCPYSEATCVSHDGGFADAHVSHWQYVFPLPEFLQRPEAAPLFCGGGTVYSPLREFLPNKYSRVGIIGLGGLGHMAVLFASEMGHEVTVFSHSPEKEKEARSLGAHRFVNSTSEAELKKNRGYYDLILNTAFADLPFKAYAKLLRADGTLAFVGVPPSALGISANDLLGSRARVAASPIISRFRMMEMLEFCAVNQILPKTEVFPMDEVNQAITKLRKNQVHYRAVLVNS